MLRRPATTIGINASDVEAYEANRQRKIWEKQQQQSQQEQSSSTFDNGTSRDQQAGGRQQQRSQKDRIMGGQARHGN